VSLRKTIRAVGFDLGETLIAYADLGLDWSSLYRRALQRCAASCGRVLDASALDAAKRVLSHYNTRIHPRTREVRAAHIFRRILLAWDVESSTALDGAIDAFFSQFQQRARAYPETGATLAALVEAGMAMGIMTDVPYGMPRRHVLADLARCGIAPAPVVTSLDAGVRKPHPAGLQRLAQQLSVAPACLLYVGNERKDIDAARAAGSPSALVVRSGEVPDWGQTCTLRKLSELMAYIHAVN